MLVQHGVGTAECKNILIDCGKTFRAAVTRFFRKVQSTVLLQCLPLTATT